MIEPRLQKYYNDKVAPQLMKDFSLTNKLAAPRLQKVTINVGLGKSLTDPKLVEIATNTLTRISGQKPVVRKAKKSISNFKIKQGMVIGLQVTLRGRRMYEFLDKLFHVTLARVRDFRGIKDTNLDGRGNITMGFKEHIVFPEIRNDEVESVHGLEVTITTTAKNNTQGRKLFELLGLPFAKKE